MHEEDFWNSWPREDERGKEERIANADRNEEEMLKEENRRGERRERNGDSQKKM